MYAPDEFILYFYIAFYGLWSYDNAIATPFLHKTLRESPILATIIFYFVNITTFAVHPAL